MKLLIFLLYNKGSINRLLRGLRMFSSSLEYLSLEGRFFLICKCYSVLMLSHHMEMYIVKNFLYFNFSDE
jgi:hypothetical protein